MEIIDTPSQMQAATTQLRSQGRRIALVPTMGCLHDGHVSLLREGRKRGDILVLSIFVNPIQFGANEDLARYPRNIPADLELAHKAQTDIVFLPTAETMYPTEFQTFVEVADLQTGLCGSRRPGHFRGVATVVAKLFHLVQPHAALFGEKDYQQLLVIRRMVTDLSMDVEIVGMPTVREPDGLAMSSRNAYLSPEERKQAVVLFAALQEVHAMVQQGEHNAQTLIDRAHQVITGAPLARVDYVELRNAATLEPVSLVTDRCVLALAVFVGQIRLIDNCILDSVAYDAT